jgi:hypothetical protein
MILDYVKENKMIDFKLELRKPSPESLQFKDLQKPSKEELDEIWNELGMRNPNEQ